MIHKWNAPLDCSLDSRLMDRIQSPGRDSLRREVLPSLLPAGGVAVRHLFFAGDNKIRRPQQRLLDFTFWKAANGISRQGGILRGSLGGRVQRAVPVQHFQYLLVAYSIESLFSYHGFNQLSF